jgi:thioredoxin-dependent peroxiredoxin
MYLVLKIILIVALVAVAVLAYLLSSTSATPLASGTAVPDLQLTDHDGASFSLGSEVAQGLTLIYFFPKADTPGCTAQSCQLGERWSEITTVGVRVLGVSTDGAEALRAFKEKYRLPFRLVADANSEMIKAFGVPLYRAGYVNRQSFLLKDGKVVWHDPKVDPATHLDRVLAAVRAL